MRSQAVDEQQQERENNFLSQFIDAPNIFNGLYQFFHWKKSFLIIAKGVQFERPANIVNYFTISTTPPTASIAALAFSLTACTLKVNLDFISPFARILTFSVRLINPFV